jgi:hypothetical protein
MIKTSLSAIAMVAVFAGNVQAADVPAVTPVISNLFNSDGPWTLGFNFVANASVSMTGLGAFDADHDGFVASHDVGLWDSSGNLLASATVGSGDTLIGDFRYVKVAPVALTAGNTYYVGANNYGVGGDLFGFLGTISSAPGVTYGLSAYAPGAALQFPPYTSGYQPGYFGGNLLISAVPEPSSYAMLIAGLALAGAVRRRKQGAPAA